MAEWPEDKKSLYGKLAPAPSLWSYLELGADLTLAPDPRRSEALKKIIGALRLPRGTSAFVPAALPDSAANNQLKPDSGFFMAGLERVNPKLVIMFGKDALGISPYKNLQLNNFQESVAKGRLILLLPSLTDVMAKQSTLDSTIIFLKSAFNKIKIF